MSRVLSGLVTTFAQLVVRAFSAGIPGALEVDGSALFASGVLNHGAFALVGRETTALARAHTDATVAVRAM